LAEVLQRVLLVATAWYVILTSVVSVAQHFIERRLAGAVRP